jgi:outer membrane protein assembly factor BamB
MNGPAPRRRARYAACLALAVLVTVLVPGEYAGSGGTAVAAVWNDPPSPAESTPSTPAAPFEGWSDPAGVGKPYGSTVTGLLTFRGNPTRTYYGSGPVPRTTPTLRWQFPRTGVLCSDSVDQRGPTRWCGSGFTGQPAVFERDGKTWMVVGAFDRALHFLDARNGERILPDFPTGDIIKGSVTVDPDGYPLVYSGSRDNYLHIVSFDRGRPTELWKLSATAVSPTKWNDDWDASPLVIDDYLFEGGENSQFHIVKLNRSYGPDGKVRINPKLVFHTPGWDAQLLRDIGDSNVSIEGSAAIYKDTVYFANSGGLVQGWDISGLATGGTPKRVFRFWTGDDTDAAMVMDEAGALYVGVQYERGTARSKAVGQMMKLDPSRPNPLVWKLDDRDGKPAGIWGTPAIYEDIVVFNTTGGSVIGVDRATGEERWRVRVAQSWPSPVIVDGVLMVGDCAGDLNAYDITDTSTVRPLWTLKTGSCIESTPAVWQGNIYFGNWGGRILSFGARQ